MKFEKGSRVVHYSKYGHIIEGKVVSNASNFVRIEALRMNGKFCRKFELNAHVNSVRNKV